MAPKPQSRKVIIVILVIGAIMLLMNKGMDKKESLSSSRFIDSCLATYSYQIDAGKQCVKMVEMTSSLRSCLISCGEDGSDVASDTTCVVFYEDDGCRTTKGGTFGTMDACDYNCIKNGVFIDPCANECILYTFKIEGGTCKQCFAGATSSACNEWAQTSMDVCSSECIATEWLPDPTTVCMGIPFTMVSNCGNAVESIGTKSCGGTCTDSTWNPPVNSNVCIGSSTIQTSNCGNTRTIPGTVDCSNACSISAWSPGTLTVCSGTSFTQTNECGDTRQATGTKVCTSTGGSGETKPIDWSKYIPLGIIFVAVIIGITMLKKK